MRCHADAEGLRYWNDPVGIGLASRIKPSLPITEHGGVYARAGEDLQVVQQIVLTRLSMMSPEALSPSEDGSRHRLTEWILVEPDKRRPGFDRIRLRYEDELGNQIYNPL